MVSKSTGVACVLLACLSAAHSLSVKGQLFKQAPEVGPYCPALQEFSGKPINVGCFESFMNLKPLRPEELDAIYSLYRYENPSSRYRRWRFDESFDGERDDLFEPDDKLAMIIHGFTDNANRPWMPQMRDALFLQDQPEKLKVILVDWHKGSQGLNYPAAARNVMMLARTTAEMLHRLMLRYKLEEKNIHLIGHSLGGQTVGQIIAWLFENYRIKIGRATGLDVASPLFVERSIQPNKSHAHFLESVHTSSGNSVPQGKLGLMAAFSHLDIYPNGGVVLQPGCEKPPTTVHCSHDLSRPFYSELLIICNKGCEFNVTNCDSALEATRKSCEGNVVDICARMNSLKDNAGDDDNEIVYFETQEDELVSPCNENWESTLMKSVQDIANLVRTGLEPGIY